MAKRPLKVFRTSAGFQDAYVATTSRKAALQAWGVHTDLFASGIAEQVSDPKLTKAALAEPGKVIRLSKGTTAQHLAAAKDSKPVWRKSPRVDASDKEKAPEPSPQRKKTPKPSREKLDRAEAAIERRAAEFSTVFADIDSKIEALHKQRDQIRLRRDAELDKLEHTRAREDDAYHSALKNWEG